MPYFLKLFGFTGNFWKAVATIEGLKVDSRATAHSHPFVLAYYNAALPRVGIWLLSFDWFYSPRHATLGLCICHHPCSCIPIHGMWLAIPSMAFLWINMLFEAKTSYWMDRLRRFWEGSLLILRNFTATRVAAGRFRCTKRSQTPRAFDWWRQKCVLLVSICVQEQLFFIYFFVKVTFLPLTELMDTPALSMFSCSHWQNPSTANWF